MLYTEHNKDTVKYHENSFTGWHNWCGMDFNDTILPCHILMYIDLHESPSHLIITKYGSVTMPGRYALVHSVAENVFREHVYVL